MVATLSSQRMCEGRSCSVWHMLSGMHCPKAEFRVRKLGELILLGQLAVDLHSLVQFGHGSCCFGNPGALLYANS